MSELETLAQIVGIIAIVFASVCLLGFAALLIVVGRSIAVMVAELKKQTMPPYYLDEKTTSSTGHVEIQKPWDDDRPATS